MYKYVKRLLDVVLSSLLFIVISPLFFTLVLVVKIDLGSPVFFRQIREGMNCKPFSMIKFRTMTEDKDEKGDLLRNELRLTKIGGFLRNTSLDELPELINMIKGEMSIIGPRPLPPHYNPFYKEEERKRFIVRGGLIPPDSVYEEPIITWDEQLKCEAEYAENLSFKKDLFIFFSVFKTIIKRNHKDYGAIQRTPLSEERREIIKR